MVSAGCSCAAVLTCAADDDGLDMALANAVMPTSATASTTTTATTTARPGGAVTTAASTTTATTASSDAKAKPAGTLNQFVVKSEPGECDVMCGLCDVCATHTGAQRAIGETNAAKRRAVESSAPSVCDVMRVLRVLRRDVHVTHSLTAHCAASAARRAHSERAVVVVERCRR
jgi:hypothetical protein